MKNRILKAVFLIGILPLFIACNPSKDGEVKTTVNTELIKKEIQEKENEFAEIFNSGEIKSIGYYAEDAISFSQNHEPLIGRQAILDYYKSNIDSISSINTISFTTKEVMVFDNGDRVLEIGYFKVVNDSNITINSGNYMSLFEKREGKYVSLRDMSVTDIPIE
jgi:ketosteroid isomerase-like protein